MYSNLIYRLSVYLSIDLSICWSIYLTIISTLLFRPSIHTAVRPSLKFTQGAIVAHEYTQPNNMCTNQLVHSCKHNVNLSRFRAEACRMLVRPCRTLPLDSGVRSAIPALACPLPRPVLHGTFSCLGLERKPSFNKFQLQDSLTHAHTDICE